MERLKSAISAMRRNDPDADISIERVERECTRHGLFPAIRHRARAWTITKDGDLDEELERIVADGALSEDELAHKNVMFCIRCPRKAVCAVFGLFFMLGAIGRSRLTLPSAFEFKPSLSPIRVLSPRKKEKTRTCFISNYCDVQPQQRHTGKQPKKQRRCDQKRLNRSMQRRDQRRGTPPNGAPLMHRTSRCKR